ncbi:MAG: hypothetical protein SGJ27_09760 [Candidatus Melainabacteria bacterium]|nr:hypothetical protein [Candidatus Melainabacteria bacterium]
MSAIRFMLAFSFCLSTTFNMAGAAELAPPLSALARMPVKEVTVFKDGHAFVLHEGTMPTKDGTVVMDYLPAPVLGTFFPYTTQKGAKLTSVVSGVRRVSIPRTSLTTSELIEGNPGAEVHVEEVTGSGITEKTVSYDATIIGVPKRTSEELDATSPPNSDEQLPQKSNLVLLKTATGTSVVNLDRIRTISFKNGFQSKLSNEEFRNLLNLKLKWDGPAKETADVGMVYLQKGLRWIPSYKVNLHTDGTADVKLQATLVNELADLNDVRANLVIGVPTFAFADNTDPIAIQNVVAQLSPHFRADSRTANGFSNAIMSQAPMLQGATNGTIGRSFGDAFNSDSEQPEVAGGSKSEDLFIFTANHITLKKGQRMIVPIGEYQMKYKDVYTLNMPFSPPPDVHMYHTPSKPELAKAFSAPKVMHNIRLSNKTAQPMTTAPVLILKDEKLIAQGMSTYTAPNSSCDVTLTAAIDVKVKKTDREIKRTNDAARIDDNSYSRVDLEGEIELTNFSDKPLEVEVKRFVLGKLISADHGGKVEMINLFEDADSATTRTSSFVWWNWYQWPTWWTSVNGMGKGTWNVTLAPRTPVDLNYKWSYFWR